MAQMVLRIEDLPLDALGAAAVFHAQHLPQARNMLSGAAEALALVFPEAPYDHSGWRKAAIADLARAGAPKRVNGVAGDDASAIAATLAWLEAAPGITGQFLGVDGAGAGNPA